jgi:hypothetical protein
MAAHEVAADDAALIAWARRVQEELGIEDLPLDADAVLGLAGVVARAVMRPAAPLTTFLAGYAAGRRAAEGADPAAAMHDAIATARASAPTAE